VTTSRYISLMLSNISRRHSQGRKAHAGEFQTLLLINDKQQEKELADGKKEFGELTSKIGEWANLSKQQNLPLFR
jgi:hypothetical protein